MTFLLFVLSGSSALLHPPLYGRLLSNNKDEDLLGELDSVCCLTSTHTSLFMIFFPNTYLILRL